MVDKLRKFGLALWYNKERVLFAVLVVILCGRAYRVLAPKPIESPKAHPIPANVPPPPEVWKERPPDPPNPPIPPAIPSADSLVKYNPFTIHGGIPSGGPATEKEPQIGVRLVRIVPWSDGGYRAELVTKGRRPRWYKEGEPFENYRLVRIDPDNNTVEIWSEEFSKTFLVQPG